MGVDRTDYLGAPLVVPCCEPSDDCEGPGYTPCARFKQDAECYRTSQIDMDELICMVIRRDEEIECLQARVAELAGKLDIIVREGRGEPADSLAADYGGTGWERSEEVQAVRDQRAELEGFVASLRNRLSAKSAGFPVRGKRHE